jgi:signal transduction histidine kinase
MAEEYLYMKKMYFMWLAINFSVWMIAFLCLPQGLNEVQLLSVCLFFAILFIIPILTAKPSLQIALFCIQSITTIIIYYPVGHELNPFVFIVHMLLIAEAIYYLSRINSLVVIVVQLGSMMWIIIKSDLTAAQNAWIGLFYLLVVVALLHYQAVRQRENDVRKRNDMLVDEYRNMKRQLVSEEERTRQDERMLIGHEIHDSVGHKLTALLMQFEAFRLTAADRDKEKIGVLKSLAEQSLEESRRAVKSFKQKEAGGLQGVIRLIRKLELESFMKINFSVRHGAFAAPLTGEQSFAIYRAVQEAMTNIMKHSSTREAHVMFECPGGTVFRFEVTNITGNSSYFEEGFGLKAMRDRLEKVGGSLEIIQDERLFVVRGSVLLVERSESYH